jgi:hypothetical protein
MLVEELESADQAFEMYKSLVVDRGATRGAKYGYARLLLERGDESAIRMIDEVMRDLPEAVLPGCATIVEYLRARGRDAEAQPYVDRYLEQQAREERARRERETIVADHDWQPHTLGAESLASLKALLASHTGVKAAWLVRKSTPPGDPPQHVVGVLRKTRLLELKPSDANSRLINELAGAAQIPEELVFIWVNGSQKSFRKRFKKVKGARIH